MLSITWLSYDCSSLDSNGAAERTRTFTGVTPQRPQRTYLITIISITYIISTYKYLYLARWCQSHIINFWYTLWTVCGRNVDAKCSSPKVVFYGNLIGRAYNKPSAPYNASTSRRRAVGISGHCCVDCADDGPVGACDAVFEVMNGGR